VLDAARHVHAANPTASVAQAIGIIDLVADMRRNDGTTPRLLGRSRMTQERTIRSTM
jgi:hypothetical protein